MTKSYKNINRSIIRWGILLLFLVAINYYPLPYYFTIPGDAKVLTEYVEVEEGNDYEGTFMLTTVRMGQANVVNYLWAMLSDNREIIPEKQIKPEGETDEQYQQRQMLMMSGSQESAIIVAYDKAGKTAYFENHGVYVTSIISGMDAEGKLEMGDRIVAVGGEEVLEAQKLLDLLGGYEIGDTVELTIERGTDSNSFAIDIMPFPEEIDETGERGGIGIANPVTDRSLIMEPKVTIDAEDIGGPSAGLMFSLEIFNQLHDQDITKGYNIAGTGTIDEDGNVGSIGGIHQKVVAADDAGAEVFFAPYENGEENSNYEVAKAKAESINTDMVIVPVDHFDDAMRYLDNLPEKE